MAAGRLDRKEAAVSKLGKRRRNMISDLPRASPPVASLDLQSDLAWVHVLALMCWPKDQRIRHQAEATFGADLLGWLETLMPSLRDLGLASTAPHSAAAAALGVAPNQLEFMPATKAHFARMTGDPLEMARDVANQVFKPAGGFKAVGDAPGSSLLVEEFSKASKGGGRMAGYMLMWVAVLATKQPDLGASINRSMAILESQQRRFPDAEIPSSRSLKQMWKDWRGIAPVWAAFIIQAHSDTGLAPKEASIEGLFDTQRLQEAMGWALWFRDFAISFKPPHSDAPIIPASEAVELAFNIEPVRPPLDQVVLDPDDTQAAYGAEHGGLYRWNPLSTLG